MDAQPGGRQCREMPGSAPWGTSVQKAGGVHAPTTLAARPAEVAGVAAPVDRDRPPVSVVWLWASRTAEVHPSWPWPQGRLGRWRVKTRRVKPALWRPLWATEARVGRELVFLVLTVQETAQQPRASCPKWGQARTREQRQGHSPRHAHSCSGQTQTCWRCQHCGSSCLRWRGGHHQCGTLHTPQHTEAHPTPRLTHRQREDPICTPERSPGADVLQEVVGCSGCF